MKIRDYSIGLILFLPITIVADIKQNYEDAKSCCANKQYSKALALYDQIIAEDPLQERAYIESARLLCDCGDSEKARCYLMRQADYGIPRQLNVAFAYGHLLLTVGCAHDAHMVYQQLHTSYPDSLSIWYNLAYISKIVVDADSCVAILEQIVAKNPDYEDAQFSLGHSYLAGGYWEKGWRQHDRFLRKTHRYTPELRTWIEEQSLAGKHVVLKPEGGLGDTIQFIRCAQWLKERGAQVTVIVQKPLLKLIERCPFIDQLLGSGSAVPASDAITTFMTVPALFVADEQMMGEGIPYIFADPALERYWGEQLIHDKQFKIGICWQADVQNDESRLLIARRGVPLKTLLRLAKVPGVTLYSLQCKVGLDEFDDEARAVVRSFGDDFDESHGSFMDTAAIMKHLDLVISADTAVAHLAGALGVPVWLLLPYSVDWRWIIGRTDSPWYPSMRIFKQSSPFDWEGVVDAVKAALMESYECPV